MDARRDRPLRRADLLDDPLALFAAWLEAARAAGAPMPEAVALATAAPDGAPSARMVLLKGVGERGFVVGTNLESRKARELAANPRVALLFHWYELGRQVRVEGRAERTSHEESAALHRDRPRASRLAAWSSRQSEPIGGRDELDAQYAAREREFDGADVPLPPFWGGIRVVPDAYEFWQHRENRLHDRFRYRRDGDGWRIDRLAP
ncbi:MAG: pyridoxamine 5'-phosphate oxidase [Pseudomonadota bacterium]